MFASVGALSSAVAFGSALPPSLVLVGAPPPIAGARRCAAAHRWRCHFTPSSLRLSIAGHVISLLFIIMPDHCRLRHFAAFHRCARPFFLGNG
ncbi:hypothetical protein [Enorma massiliensis]|uniref:hypothetical protein n=1 Tax=Enorma massiliensis TaxID=1472761 RepID=UPI0023F07EF3|nr:hypothetical protein [Enorma massiliensis]